MPGRRQGDRYCPPAYEQPHHNTPQQFTQNVAPSHYSLPHRSMQTQQVDSWRSYRNDTVNLQASTNLHQSQWAPQTRASHPLYGVPPPSGSAPYFQPSHVQVAHNTSREPLRSVHNYARYPTYRVDKIYRAADGSRDRSLTQQAAKYAPLASSQGISQYTLRPRRPDQIAPYSSAALADIPLPSIEPTDPSSASANDVPIRYNTPRRSRTGTPGVVQDPPAPKATKAYMKSAAQPPALRDTAQKLLVVLDLNGTLLVRPNRRNDPTKFKIRPGVTQLLDYLFNNHVVMVYSSARPDNVSGMVNNLIHPNQRKEMAGIWARDKLDLTYQQYNNKVQVYKKLEKIWADNAVQSKAEPGTKWNQTNTVLVDDSQIKGLAQPHNLLQVPEFENNAPKEGGAALREWQLKEQAIVKSLELKLEELKWQVDISRLIREWQAGKRTAPGVVDETIDQKTHRRIEQQQPEPSPAPSVGQPNRATSVAGQSLSQPGLPSPFLTPSSLPQSIEDDDSSDAGVDLSYHSPLDHLEREIDRNLNIERADGDKHARRSESPIDEAVWKEILGGKEEKDTEKGSLGAVPPTPESMTS
ncbi:hypothetical protein, variant 1 [Exophiala sideris]|uniref:Mitochondrial import inner membrane translocase subunit TIM50 n=1 Tax=Exophiala sideris TaxID=1016849 RepID=A0A0D1ZFT7_9EURO|nr:hypothetical protein, variant 1 [Exophiala sideris]